MPVYSHSKLATYETCPRQYKLRYIDRIRPPEGEGGFSEEKDKVSERLLKKREDDDCLKTVKLGLAICINASLTPICFP